MSTGQVVHFVTAPDGVRLAYTDDGHGPAMVVVGHWPSHVVLDRSSPVWQHWIRGLGDGRRLIRYDNRATGLSSSGTEPMSLRTWTDDLESVVEAAGLGSFALLGMLNGGPVAVEYAARHPARVEAMVLYGTFALGRARRGDARSQQESEALRILMQLSWEEDNPAIRQLWSARFIPGASRDELTSFNELQRIAAGPLSVSESLNLCHHIDVTARARCISAPTLVIHSRNDAMVPVESGRHLAALITGADFLLLESDNHILLPGEAAWEAFRYAVDSFLRPRQAHAPIALKLLTKRERELLELIARGLENEDIAKALYISPRTVRNHITHVFGKLEVTTRAQAIILARDAGIGGR